MKLFGNRYKKVMYKGDEYIVCDNGRAWRYCHMAGKGFAYKVVDGWVEIYFNACSKNHNYVQGYVKPGVTVTLHKLLALAFVLNPNNYIEVDHINGDPTDNRIENLRWCDRFTNNRNRKPFKPYYRHKTWALIKNVETGEIFAGPTKAGKELGIDSTQIIRALRNPQYTCHKCHWVYIEEENK